MACQRLPSVTCSSQSNGFEDLEKRTESKINIKELTDLYRVTELIEIMDSFNNNKKLDEPSRKLITFPNRYNGLTLSLDQFPPSAKSLNGHWTIGYENKLNDAITTYHVNFDAHLACAQAKIRNGENILHYKIPVGVVPYSLKDMNEFITKVTERYQTRVGLLDCFQWAVHAINNLPQRIYFDYVDNLSYGCIYLYWINCDSSCCLRKEYELNEVEDRFRPQIVDDEVIQASKRHRAEHSTGGK